VADALCDRAWQRFNPSTIRRGTCPACRRLQAGYRCGQLRRILMEFRPTSFAQFMFSAPSESAIASANQQGFKNESHFMQKFGAYINMSAVVYNGMFYCRESFQLGDRFLPPNATLHVDYPGLTKLAGQICTTASAFERIDAANALERMMHRYHLHDDPTLREITQAIRNSIHDPQNNPALSFTNDSRPGDGGIHAKRRFIDALDKQSADGNRFGKAIGKERGTVRPQAMVSSDNNKQKRMLQLKQLQEQSRMEQKASRAGQRQENTRLQKECDALEIYTSDNSDDDMAEVVSDNKAFPNR
jgi:hypothetical protein